MRLAGTFDVSCRIDNGFRVAGRVAGHKTYSIFLSVVKRAQILTTGAGIIHREAEMPLLHFKIFVNL